ncbi:MAG: glycosyltransferase [Candidatus Sumerlaeota bacterium]|nr:glycosyltransferase [Candidatus Sumerlaeota bacterium]
MQITGANPGKFRILCLSHLMWEETLFQRPQQLMRRFARMGHPVAYLCMIGTRRYMKLRQACPPVPMRGVTADGLRFRTMPFVPIVSRIHALRWLNNLRMIRAVAAERRRLTPGPTILWLYHPDIISMAPWIKHDLLVYDVMDQFEAFQKSSRKVVSREERLLRMADVVFTGGRTLHESKAAIRPDAQCFPSGVEVGHFSRALADETKIPEDLARLPRPVLGYIGAVDERIDYALVEAVCRARPNWSFVFIGPLVDRDCPPIAAPNFHYLGARPYALLPEYLKGFDVATMPWVQSQLTAHISPTKTPEYLAAGRPVVSVPTPDVLRDYSDVVSFARTPEEFVAACERLIQTPPPNLATSLSGRAAAASWDAIAQAMHEAIISKLSARW